VLIGATAGKCRAASHTSRVPGHRRRSCGTARQKVGFSGLRAGPGIAARGHRQDFTEIKIADVKVAEDSMAHRKESAPRATGALRIRNTLA